MRALTSARGARYTASCACNARMVAIAQLAERQIVALKVTGSSPVSHPTHYRSTLSRECRPVCFVIMIPEDQRQ